MKTSSIKACYALLRLGIYTILLSSLSISYQESMAQGTDFGAYKIPFEDLTSYGNPTSAISYTIMPDGTQIKEKEGYNFWYQNHNMSSFMYFKLDNSKAYNNAIGYHYIYNALGQITHSEYCQYNYFRYCGGTSRGNYRFYDSFGTYTRSHDGYRTSEANYITRNANNQVLEISRYDYNCNPNTLTPVDYTEYKYKDGIIDSIIDYKVSIKYYCMGAEDTTLKRVISNIEYVELYDDKNPDGWVLGSHKIWLNGKTSYVRKTYDALGRLLLSTIIDELGDSTQTTYWEYPNLNTVTKVSRSTKTTQEYDAKGRLLTLTVAQKQGQDWKTQSKEERVFDNDTIRSITYSDSSRAYRKFVFSHFAIDFEAFTASEDSVGLQKDTSSNVTKKDTVSNVTKNDKISNNNTQKEAVSIMQNQINIAKLDLVEGMTLISSNGKVLPLAVAQTISLAHISGIHILRIIYKDGTFENMRVFLP